MKIYISEIQNNFISGNTVGADFYERLSSDVRYTAHLNDGSHINATIRMKVGDSMTMRDIENEIKSIYREGI
jgi:hypothetical protein